MSNKSSTAVAANPSPAASKGPAKQHSVPLKVDATQLNSALQKVAAARQAGPQVKTVSPAEPIKQVADAISELYTRFDALKKLAAEISGLNQNDKIPAHVKIKKINIEFSLTKDGETEDHEAALFNPTIVGDISSMLTTEYGFLISSIKDYAAQLEDYSSKTTESCTTALKRWEETSNRRIVSADDAATVATPETKLSSTDKPVTLADK